MMYESSARFSPLKNPLKHYLGFYTLIQEKPPLNRSVALSIKTLTKLLIKTNTMSTEQPQSNRLYVGNIPWSTTVEELQGLFTDAENIEIPTVRFISFFCL